MSDQATVVSGYSIKLIDNGDGTYSLGMNVAKGSSASASLTRPNDTTTYGANDVVGTSPAANLPFANVLSVPGGQFIILGAKIRIDAAAVPTGMSGFRLHLYNAAPTAIADNTAFNLPAGDRAKYLGYITLSAPVDLGETLFSEDNNINFAGKLAANSTTLYGILETLGAYTPSASVVKTITLNVAGV